MNHDEYLVLFPNLVENIHERVIHLLFHNNDKCIGGLKHLFEIEEVVNHVVDILSAKCFG